MVSNSSSATLVSFFLCLLFDGASSAQEIVIKRARVAWLGRGSDPVLAGACVAYGLPCEWRGEATATGERQVLGSADIPARLDVFPGFLIGKTKVPVGQYALQVERADTGWLLALVDGATLTSSDPRSNSLAAPVLYRIPLAAGPPLPAKHQTFTIRWEVSAKGQAPDRPRLLIEQGSASWVAELLFEGMKKPPFIPEGKREATTLRSEGRIVAHVDHGSVNWREDFTKDIAKLSSGARWRLGANWWTSLDTRVDLRLGEVSLPAGRWHLLLVRGKRKDEWNLACLPVADTLRAGLDPLSAAATKGGIIVPLTAVSDSPPLSELSIAFAASPTGTELVLRFGPYGLTTPARME